MKNTKEPEGHKNVTPLQQTQKSKVWAIIVAIIIFAVISWIYFYPVIQGKRIKQHDMEMQNGMAQELTQHRESTGEIALWTNAPFGGMPAWNITVPQKTNLFMYVRKGLSIGLPSPLGSVFIAMLGFFLLLMWCVTVTDFHML